jgi:hypothetical protein
MIRKKEEELKAAEERRQEELLKKSQAEERKREKVYCQRILSREIHKYKYIFTHVTGARTPFGCI